MIITIILVIALLATVAALFFLISRLNNLKPADQDAVSENLFSKIVERQRLEAEAQRRNYEESAAKILDETRRQYEYQISRLEERLHIQAEELRKASATQFEVLAAKALERQSDRLTEENRSELVSLLNPLRENLGDFRKAVNQSYMEENASREALNKQITSLISANHEIGVETRRLAEALHGDTRFQGQWGESILESLIQNAGFLPDIHYFTQAATDQGNLIKNEYGKGLRPDLIFLLPDDRKIIIDAKTSLTSYLDYCNSQSKSEESAALRSHVDSVKRHIDELGKTQYHKNIKGALEHTLMFMPNDGAFIAALRGDKNLPEYALKHNVVIVAPAHLLSILNLVAQIWRVDKQNRNAEQIARIGGYLYDKMASFLTDFESLGRSLETSRKAFEKSRAHLAGSATSIAARTQKLKDMGAKTTKTIPPDYMDQNENDSQIITATDPGL